MAEIGVTEVAATSVEIVSSLVQETLKDQMILGPTVMDYSAWASKGADKVDVPRRTQFAAADKTENTGLTAQELTFSVDSIALTKHKAVYASLERIASLQASVNVESEIIQEMAKELAVQLDKDIIVELKLASASTPDHILDYVDTVGDTLALADIANARKLLNEQNVPMEDRFMVIPPAQEANLLAISNFISAESYGSREALLNGEIGRVFGFNVLLHNGLADADTLFYHKSHVGWALQGAPEFKTDEDLAKVAQEFLMNQIYGVEVLDSGLRGVYYSGA